MPSGWRPSHHLRFLRFSTDPPLSPESSFDDCDVIVLGNLRISPCCAWHDTVVDGKCHPTLRQLQFSRECLYCGTLRLLGFVIDLYVHKSFLFEFKKRRIRGEQESLCRALQSPLNPYPLQNYGFYSNSPIFHTSNNKTTSKNDIFHILSTKEPCGYPLFCIKAVYLRQT